MQKMFQIKFLRWKDINREGLTMLLAAIVLVVVLCGSIVAQAQSSTEKVPFYSNQGVFIDTVIFAVYKTNDAQITALKVGEIDIADAKLDEMSAAALENAGLSPENIDYIGYSFTSYLSKTSDRNTSNKCYGYNQICWNLQKTCKRKKWMEMKGLYKEKYNAKTLRTFEIGDLFHRQAVKELTEKCEQFGLHVVSALAGCCEPVANL
jgi:hypothetical protein